MNIKIKGINVYYEVSGEGKDVLILHGWGANTEVMKKAAESFEGKMRVFNLDLPGFGKSEEPLEDDWDIYTYGDFVKEFVQAVGIVKPVILAHSFGGRIALILAGKGLIDINKMILTGCAGIKPVYGPLKKLKMKAFRLAKKLLRKIGLLSEKMEEKIKSRHGSTDYMNADKKMREIMVRTVNEDLKYLLSDIRVPCLLVWGEGDDATPLADGKTMERLIPDAGLVVMPGSGHFAFLENAPWFGNIVRSFCAKEMEENE